MIKINLLGDSLSQASGRRSESAAEKQAEQVYVQGEPGRKSSLPLAGFLVALALCVIPLAYYLYLNGQVQKAEQEKAKLEQEKRDLEQYTRLYNEYKAKKELLKKKIEVLGQLKENQELTVKVVEQIANCTPDDIWFSELNYNGRSIQLSGFGRSFEAVNIFRGRLADNRAWFNNVNHSTSVRNNSQNVSFSITFELAPTAK